MTSEAQSVPAPGFGRSQRALGLGSLVVAVVGVSLVAVAASAVSDRVRPWWWLVAGLGCVAALAELIALRSQSHATRVLSPSVPRRAEPLERSSGTGPELDRQTHLLPPAPQPEAVPMIDASLVPSRAASPPSSVTPDGRSAQGWSCDALAVPKSSYTPDEAEDSWASDTSARTAALSDGASSSFMAREWAQVLTSSYVAAPLDQERAGLRPWLVAATQRWSDDCSDGAGQWWVGESVQRGSHATLVGLRLTPTSHGGTWDAAAVGDSCLVHLGPSQDSYRRIVAFPIDRPDGFDRHPDLLSTINGSEVDVPVLRRASGEYRDGDVFLLLSDAIAEWALAQETQVERVWDHLLAMEPADFTAFVDRERTTGALHDDDTTVVRIRTGQR